LEEALTNSEALKDEYEADRDSLFTENRELVEEKEELEKDLAEMRERLQVVLRLCCPLYLIVFLSYVCRSRTASLLNSLPSFHLTSSLLLP
jgi:hypothetical protein